MSRLLDFLKGILSLAAIVLLLVAVPVALVALVGFPFPTEWVPVPTIRRHIVDGDIPGVFVVKVLAVVVWLVWIQLAVAVLVEGFSLLRGRVSGRAPVLPGLQPLAGTLVASTVLIVSSFTPGRSAGAAPIVPIDQLDASLQASRQGVTQLAGSGRGHDGVEPNAIGAVGFGGTFDDGESEPERAPAPKAVGGYATKPGDNWWDMAERLLGDGMRWKELRDLNVGKTMLTGDVISTETETVRAGWRLDVPADADVELLETAVAVDQIVEAAPEFGTPTIGGHLTLLPSGPHAEPEPADGVPTGKPEMLVYEGPTGAIDPGPGVPYQVVEGDNLWDIAERHLADPFRWPEIFERSTDLEQSFGRRITDPNLIWPDSILWLPTDASDVPGADLELVSDVVGSFDPEADSADRSAEEPGDDPVVVAPDDLRRATAAAGAAAQVDIESGPVAGPEPAQESTPEIELEAVSEPGPEETASAAEKAEPPAEEVASPAEQETAQELESEPAVDAGPAIDSWPPQDPSPEDPETDPSRSGTTSVGAPEAAAFGAGGLLVASGLLGLLRRARRLRLSEAGERSQPDPPPFELAELETVLRNSADSGLASSVHRAIASLAARPIVAGEPLAAPEVIRVFSDRIEVVQNRHDPDLPAPGTALDGPVPETIGDRTVARLSVESLPAPSGDANANLLGEDVVAPMCVTVGRGLMVNLESFGVVSITGTAHDSAGLVRSMVHELASGPARRSVTVRVSDWLPGADLHTHVRCGPLDGLVAELRGWLEAVDLGLAGADRFSAYAMRASGLTESLPGPLAVFAAATDAPALKPLVERALEHAMPLAVVFSGDLTDTGINPRAVLDIGGEVTRLDPYGFSATTQHLDHDLLIGAEALLQHARHAPMIERSEDGLALAAADFETDEANEATEETPEHDIVTERPNGTEAEVTDQATDGGRGMLIKILGPLEVSGGPEGLSEEELSLLAFLALVGPSTAAQVRDAVWPGGAITDERFDAVIERLRTQLQHWFPDAGDGRYRVRSVITDLGSARRWISQAEAMSDERYRNMLHLALSDVRGEPFAAASERWWQWTADHKMGIATQASTLLMDACFDLCDSAYGANDIHLAKWACDVGARVDPIHETVAIRRVQLMQILDLTDQAEAVVEEWEFLYSEIAGRPAPRGPRAALRTVAPPQTMVAPHVG